MALPRPRFGGAQNMEVNTKEEETRQINTTNFMLEDTSDKVGQGEENLGGNPDMAETRHAENVLSPRDSGLVGSSHRQIQVALHNNTKHPAEKYFSSKSFTSYAEPESSKQMGVSGPEEDSETICNMPQASKSRVESLDVCHLEQLLKIFCDLGIKASPKPYTRLRDNFSGHEDSTILTGGASVLSAAVEDTPVSKDVSQRDLCRGVSSGDDHGVVYCKNLFLKDRKGQFYVIILPEDGVADLKKLKQQLNAYRNLSFGDENALSTVLQLKPGSVTPLAIMHDTAKDVRVAIDRCLMTVSTTNSKLAFHPLVASKQIEITFPELKCFCENFARELEILTDKEKGEHDNEFNTTKTKPRQQKTYKSSNRQDMKPVSQKSRPETKKAKENDSNGSVQNQKCREKNAGITDESGRKGISENFCHLTDIGENEEKTEFQNQKVKENIFVQVPDMKQRTEVKTLCVTMATTDTAVEQHEDNNQKMDYLEETNGVLSSRAESDPLTVDNCMMRLKWYDRKGKLKSYLKKSCRTSCDKTESGNDCYATPQIKGGFDDESCDVRCLEVESSSTQYYAATSCDSESRENPTIHDKLEIRGKAGSSQTERLDDIKQEQLLPEVQQFYQSLEDLNVCYREVDLSCSDSKTLGPSVGCRCLLLKDKGNRYYFVVSHEFYELDHGRLKKALKPRKKIVNVGAEEIMTVLRVDPARVTPFAYTNRNIRDIRIFFTNKIRHASLVLSIQSPFSHGHRIVLTSSELQRYLTLQGANIEHVEEKHWPTRYNTIFSQFEKTIVDMSQSSQEKDKDQLDARTVLEVQDDVENDSQESRMLPCKSRMLLDLLWRIIPAPLSAVLSGPSHVNVMKAVGNSVDPPQSGTASVCNYFGKENESTALQLDPHISSQGISKDTKSGRTVQRSTSVSKTRESMSIHSLKQDVDSSRPLPTDAVSNEKISATTPHPPRARSLSMDNLTIEDIAKHLNEHGVEFHLKMAQKTSKSRNLKHFIDSNLKRDSSEWDHVADTGAAQRTDCKEMRNKTRLVEGDSPLYNALAESDGKETSKGVRFNDSVNCQNDSDIKYDSDESSDDEDDFVENCSIIQLQDQENTVYVIVGGESDFITTKRFRRRCNVSKTLKLRECYSSFTAQTQGTNLCQTPFSIAILNNATLVSSKCEIKVALTSSVYIDPNTLLKFTLDSLGSSLTMTTTVFENYAKKVGCEVWYMP